MVGVYIRRPTPAQSGEAQGMAKIKVVRQHRDDKHEELVLEERQFADSLISEHDDLFNRGPLRGRKLYPIAGVLYM